MKNMEWGYIRGGVNDIGVCGENLSQVVNFKEYELDGMCEMIFYIEYLRSECGSVERNESEGLIRSMWYGYSERVLVCLDSPSLTRIEISRNIHSFLIGGSYIYFDANET